MEFEELRSKANMKVLLRGKSGTGKTMTTAEVVGRVLRGGNEVLVVDTESEFSTTLVDMVETGKFERGVVGNLEYVQAGTYDELSESVNRGDGFDLLVVDTLDHKHSYTLKKVTDARTKADADWNQYPSIYSNEKDLMEKIGKADCNVLCTLDPESGSMDKPKGAQTNIHGYFTVVVDMMRTGDEWSNKVRNWVNKSNAIGKEVDNLVEALGDEVGKRM